MCITLFVLATVLWHLGMKVRCRKRRTWLPCSPIHWDACKRILMVRGMRESYDLSLAEVRGSLYPLRSSSCRSLFFRFRQKTHGQKCSHTYRLNLCASIFRVFFSHWSCFLIIMFFFFSAPYSSTSTMNMFWSFFVTSLARPGVPEFVLRVFNAKFYSLPWQNFLPTLHNLELMVQVCWISLEFICHVTPLSELVQPKNLSANGTHQCC